MNRFFISLKILTRSFKKVILFEIMYKFMVTAIFTPIIVGTVKVAMRLAGINYLTNSRISDFLARPTTIAMFFVIVVLYAIISLIEIGGIIYCYNQTYFNQRVEVVDMMREGLKTAFRILWPQNLLIIIFPMIFLPINYRNDITGSITAVQVINLFIEFLKEKPVLALVLSILYIAILWFGIRWILGIGYYIAEKQRFMRERKSAVQLSKKRYVGIVVSLLLELALFMIVLVALYLLITFVITKILMLIFHASRAYTYSLLTAKVLFNLWHTIYSCLMMPAAMAIVMGTFFALKRNAQEEEVIPEPVKRDEKKEERQKKKKYKSIMYGIFVISAVFNLLYLTYGIGFSGSSFRLQLFNKTEIAAHRGFSAEAPENTIPAFESAIEHFSDYVELDVQETKDGEVIVLHDSNFKRVSGLNKKVWNVNYEDIEDLDVGSWFSEKFTDTKIPTLEEVLIMSKGKLKLNIEIKLTGHEKNLEQSVAELIHKYHLEDECVVTSFQSKALKNVKKYNKHIRTGYILKVAYGDFSKVKFADALSVNYSFATSALINDAHMAGKEVYVWTVNTPEAIDDMVKKGVDMIITDDPVLAKETITSYETTPYLVDLIKYYTKTKK